MTKFAIRLIGGALAAFISALVCHVATAAEVEQHLISGSAVTISIDGEIVDGDAQLFRSAVESAAKAGYSIAEVTLDSIGGSLLEGAKIVRLVRAANLKTSITSRATCASACFLAFAAGSTKLVDLAARVGVHVASDEFGAETPASIAATGAMARIAKRLHVPAKIIERMVSTPASGMFWLGRSDLVSMGAIMTNHR